MPTRPVVTSNNRASLPDNNGDDITAERTTPNQPLVTCAALSYSDPARRGELT